MKQTLLMESVMGQVRLAVIEDGALCELYVERPGAENLSGNIYLGRVANVLPGMNAAFVDIGAEKNGFLSANDVRADIDGDHALAEALKKKSVDALLRPGRDIIVQVVKSQSGTKGPRLSNFIALPGRSMVLMPDVRYIGVSRKIVEPAERARLHEIGKALTESGGAGLILRTASQGMTEAPLRDEYEALLALWREIRDRAAHAIAPKRLYADTSLAMKAVRDMLSEDTETLWTDDAAQYDALIRLSRQLAPRWTERIRPHEDDVPLFDLYRVDEQLEKSLQKYVWLRSGGSLVIEQTEALTVIDVNTGKYTGRKDLGETVFRINCEAAREIMRQLRLRDLGGIIVVDFIDMAETAHREALLELLRAEAMRDRNRVTVAGMTSLGLVEMTRKKVRQPITRQLMHTCSACGGNGAVPSHETTARKIEREIWRRRRAGEAGSILVAAQAPVCGWLRTIGAPPGGETYACPDDAIATGEYRLSPADPSAMPAGAVKLR